MPEFEENAPTFAENALGQSAALFTALGQSGDGNSPDEFVFADDSRLRRARAWRRTRREIGALRGPERHQRGTQRKTVERSCAAKPGDDRESRFRLRDRAGQRAEEPSPSSAHEPTESILESPTGTGGFGYDPVFYFSDLKKSFAELSRDRKKSTQPPRQGLPPTSSAHSGYRVATRLLYSPSPWHQKQNRRRNPRPH